MIGRLLNIKGKNKRGSPHADQPLLTASFTVIDTELTGLKVNKDSIVSFGAVRMSGGRISLGDTFYRLVRPTAALTAASVVIHGIMPCDVAGKEDLRSVTAEFANFCSNSVLIGHFVCIDLQFINRELKRMDRAPLSSEAVDTVEVYRWLAKRGVIERNVRAAPRVPTLYALARLFDIPFSETHHAFADAFITAQLFQRFLPLLQEEGITTIGDLLRVGDPGGGRDRLTPVGEIGNL